ncbi:HdeD family acid-resistance protein [Microvirga arsenatis]|uniref:HdeD family acid-resistance protein n=1 Tax=Microvirga arsenatis TaxID=2692265 RepID=A0ABW9YZC1_9HYPH|nr:HdeD family acid-resistance protein [Microvirga arsenatis]NBJ12111.1 HdeD family acid-resistance protein [Microvirga arsenatis]NBJ25763.1 HdeD family acid-resistance protein [Microvirga arsenatis]
MASGPSGTLDPLDRTHAMSALLAQNWWALALRGVLAIVFALIAFLSPGATILSLVLFFSAYMLVDGVFGIVSGIRAASNHQRWGLLVLEGILNILVGIVAFAMPTLTVLFFVTLTAVWSLVTGVLMIVAAFKLNPDYGRGWLIFSGLVSVLFGVALLIAPLVGAVVLTWWLGAYALAFGIGLLVLAFKLKGRRDDAAGSTGTLRA